MSSRGRLALYQKLSSDLRLAKHLAETDLLKEKSLFIFLETYNAVVIKPVFGPGEIFVSLENNQYKIISKSNLVTFIKKENLYEYLVSNELTQKFYIIQPKITHSSLFQKSFQSFVTVHRSSLTSKWKYVSHTAKSHSIFGKLFYKLSQRKIENIAFLAAKILGESFPECNTMVIEIEFNLKGEIWIQDTLLHLPRSKWDQHQILYSNRFLSSYVPETDLMTESSFKHFIHKYNEIILKPCIGQEGNGVIKVSSNDDRKYEIDTGKFKHKNLHFKEAYQFLKEHYLTEKEYIIQKRLPLAMINDSPIDIRVLTQKNEASWAVTGKIIKVAKPGVFNTNPPKKYIGFKDGIEDSNIDQDIKSSLNFHLDKICLIASKKLEQKKPDIHTIGFDIAITKQGDIWIIEGNYAPDLYMFYTLEEKSMYLKIMKTKEKQASSLVSLKK